MRRLADYVIDNLYILGINQYFSLTGRGLLYLTDALAANERVTKVFMHHEQACAYAACGFTDASSLPSVCMVSTGCGSTNAISGVLNAWQDNLPVIFISGQNKLNETTRFSSLNIRTHGNQEADIVSMISSITKFSIMVDNPKKIRDILIEAYQAAMSARKGPVWIDIPLDIQNQFVDLPDVDYPKLSTVNHNYNKSFDSLNELLHRSKKPLVLIGTGVRDSGKLIDFEKFINHNNLPVVFSSSAVDIFGLEENLSIGSVGALGGTPAGNIVLQNADLVLVLGSRLSSVTTGDDLMDFARLAKIVLVDVDLEEHLLMRDRIELIIHSDLKYFFEMIDNVNIPKVEEEWLEYCKKIKSENKFSRFFKNDQHIDLHQFAELITRNKKNGHHFVMDSGLNEIIIPAAGYFSPLNRCIHPYSQGSMGYALPASVGVHYASKSDVNVIVGDGSIMLNLQELQTITSASLPIKIFLINNQNYSIIRTRQSELFRNRTIGTDESNGVTTPNYEKVSKAFGINYLKISSYEDLEKQLLYIFSLKTPIVIEVFTDPSQKYLKPSIYKDDLGRLTITKLDDAHLHI